mmetsp:Transcript_14758/g.29919  ORF Transcript_14758/g.29919 Transcript_14758/m.29919 type:complete len:160 (+) Transcript_14758:36-515(+)
MGCKQARREDEIANRGQTKDVDAELKESCNDEHLVQRVRRAISRDIGGYVPMLVNPILDFTLPPVWKELPPTKVRRYRFGATYANGKLFALGGISAQQLDPFFFSRHTFGCRFSSSVGRWGGGAQEWGMHGPEKHGCGLGSTASNECRKGKVWDNLRRW